jgi:pimeloyl-ACP methyl ester carboxylesterase
VSEEQMGELEHHQAKVNGISMHYVEQGSGPAVVLCHGFPELWYSWRHQIGALVGAGYRAIAPDQRGYGETDRPAAIEEYDMAHLTADLAALLDHLGERQAVFVGHDWGGAVVWQIALRYPDRVRGVVGVNTPFNPRSAIRPTEAFKLLPDGRFNYILYFQEPGVAEAELSKDVRLTMSSMLRGPAEGREPRPPMPREGQSGLLARSGSADRPSFLRPEELDYFVTAFERTGFSGGLNWYRNMDRNWELSEGLPEKIMQPSLMIMAEKDAVLTPAMADGMEQWVPNLRKELILGSGHWTQQEKPKELNLVLIRWLDTAFEGDKRNG